jgi:hypothetical protein
VQEKKHKNKHKIDIPSVHQSQMKKHKYKKVDGREKRSVSKPQYVETLLVADPTMVEFHEDGDIETYLLTIMNMVIICRATRPKIHKFRRILSHTRGVFAN